MRQKKMAQGKMRLNRLVKRKNRQRADRRAQGFLDEIRTGVYY